MSNHRDNTGISGLIALGASALVVSVGACLGIASVALADASDAEMPAADANVIEGRYIVVYDHTDEGVRAETAERESELGFESTQRYASAVDGFAARLTPDQLRTLNRDPEVELVSEDRRVEAVGYVPRAPGEPTPPTGVRRILAATGATVREASGKSVAVIDTGIQLDHPDLNAVDGHDCVDPATPADDEAGHGTHVAGTIAARNDGTGVVGVAPGTKVYAVRVLDAYGNGTFSQVLCGINWVTANASELEIRVPNMSLGGFGPPLEPCATTTDAMHVAICNSTAAGVNYVAAAGNHGFGFDLPDFPVTPAAYPEVLTVTALTDWDGTPGAAGSDPIGYFPDDQPAFFTNYAATEAGRAHTIAAPGVAISSTWPGSTYKRLDGTSMAAPHAAGLMALCIDDAGTDGACANRAPAEAIAALRGQAESFGITHPSYGFLHDPQHSPPPWAYFGFLAVAPGAGPPSNDCRFGGVKRNTRKGTATLTVQVPGPGELKLAKTKMVEADEQAAQAGGRETLLIEPRRKARKKLAEEGEVIVTARVTYTALGWEDPWNTERKRIKLIQVDHGRRHAYVRRQEERQGRLLGIGP
jgi:subtilisin